MALAREEYSLYGIGLMVIIFTVAWSSLTMFASTFWKEPLAQNLNDAGTCMLVCTEKKLSIMTNLWLLFSHTNIHSKVVR